MEHFEEQLKKIRNEIRFDPERKAAVRNYLARMTEAHVAVMARAQNRRAPFSIQSIFTRRAAPIFASALVFVVLSGGTSFAAQDALPGDILYAIKVSVNERVVAALKTSPEEKADYDAELAILRLDEASTLAKRGPLDEETKVGLAENFIARTTEVKRTLEELKREKPEQALAIADRFSKELDDRVAAFDDEETETAGAARVLLAAPDRVSVPAPDNEQREEERENERENKRENERAVDASPESSTTPTGITTSSEETFSTDDEQRLVPRLRAPDKDLESSAPSTTPPTEYRRGASKSEDREIKNRDTLSGAVRRAGRDFHVIREELRDARAEEEKEEKE